MKRKALTVLLLVMVTSLLVSCSKKNDDREQIQSGLETEVYSNLLDENSREIVEAALLKAGIPAVDIESFIGQVDYFNSSIDEYGLVREGFKEKIPLQAPYDPYKMQDLWDERNPDFMGYNCRITSYGLMKNLINIGNYEEDSSNILIFDEHSIENGPDSIFSQKEIKGFRTLYHSIDAEGAKNLEDNLSKVKDYWKSKKLSFEKAGASLISVFFHEEEGYLFIGHVGILVPDIGGNLIFLEKVAFQEPYQAIRFKDRNKLNEYLMGRYNNSWGQDTIPPFIMENDELMEGYKVTAV
ncbi:MAG: DUF4300 family protein [Anaerovoracaceae bacterium]|jgi:hypothetical protein